MTSKLRPRARGTVARVGCVAAAAAIVLTPVIAAATPASFTFTPPNPGWTPVLIGGAPVVDAEGDAAGARDVVGDTANPALYVAADATHIYFRIRLDETPQQSSTNFAPFGWGCFIDTDGNRQTYEFSSLVDGINNPDLIKFFKNTVTTAPNLPSDPPDLPAVSAVSAPLDPAVGHARVVSAGSNFGGTPDFFLDWAVERSVALAAGFDPSRPLRIYCGSSNSGSMVDADCTGSTAGACALDSQFSDPLTLTSAGSASCGDGLVGPGEGCDDGNLVNGDGCSALCLRELGQPCTSSAQCESGFCGSSASCSVDPDSGVVDAMTDVADTLAMDTAADTTVVDVASDVADTTVVDAAEDVADTTIEDVAADAVADTTPIEDVADAVASDARDASIPDIGNADATTETPTISEDNGGCGCRLAASTPPSAYLVLAVGACLLRRRRVTKHFSSIARTVPGVPPRRR